MKLTDTFRCEKLRCDGVRAAVCLARQDVRDGMARSPNSKSARKPGFPQCAGCEQGQRIRKACGNPPVSNRPLRDWARIPWHRCARPNCERKALGYEEWCVRCRQGEAPGTRESPVGQPEMRPRQLCVNCGRRVALHGQTGHQSIICRLCMVGRGEIGHSCKRSTRGGLR